jgi:replicative DNA helicase
MTESPLAETAVLAGIMADETSRSSALAMEHLTVDDFTNDTNRTLFEACRTLTAPFNEIDVAIESGLNADCMEISSRHGGGDIMRYIDLLIASRQTTQVRAALLRATDSLAEGDPQEVASAFIASCSGALASRRHAISCGIAVKSALADFLATNEGGANALPTGFNCMDELLGGGFKAGTVTIVAARPGVGKSALALWFTLQTAKHGKNTAFVSLEMSATECAGRILCAQSGQRRVYSKGGYSPQSISELHDTATSMRSWPIRFKDDAEDSIDSIVAFVQRESIERGVDLVVVDYLQLVNAPGESPNQRVSYASRAFKKLSMQQDVPVIVLSQLNRALETSGRAPALSDLRDSGSIEQDADIVMLLSRQGESDTADTDSICVHVAKNRNGPGGKVNLTFEKAFGRFSLPERLN